MDITVDGERVHSIDISDIMLRKGPLESIEFSMVLNAAVNGVRELEDGFDKTILNILKPLERILKSIALIAKFSCKQLQKFNIPCDTANYPIKEDSIYYQKPARIEL